MGLMNNFFNWYHENGIIPNIWKGATGQLSQEKINRENIEFQRERNEIEDARYQEETNYNRNFAESERAYQIGRDQLADRRYNEQLKYNRAFAEEEQAYNRAFAAEEQAYNRAFAENERAYQREWALNQRDYERSLQQKIFEREDTAIARQAEALRAQGINPLSQSMNGLGAGSVVSSSSPNHSSYSGTSAGTSTAPSSIGFSGGSPTPIPALSGRQGKALQKAMITSQGINGLLAPILQTFNTIDSLKGNGIQRDVLNAQAVKTQAEANISVMNMFDTANRLNLKENAFLYGVNKDKIYRFNVGDESYRPYSFSPQMLNKLEGNNKSHQDTNLFYDTKLKQLEANRLDSVGDSMKYLTGKILNGGSDQLIDTFSGIIEKLLLNAFKLK